MTKFETTRLSPLPDATAPDGTDVRLLGALPSGSFAHFTLAPGSISLAVAHRSVEEIWYFVSGRGEVWRKQDGREEIVPVEAGVALTIPLGTAFQFRASGHAPLVFVAVTMPPWPGADEAFQVQGKWPASVTLP
jgi:mannose-6-phosphate isomerase-like protein (cupin superfamily)